MTPGELADAIQEALDDENQDRQYIAEGALYELDLMAGYAPPRGGRMEWPT